MTDPRLPLTLLTGFLGAGKTTLLNAVLADAGCGPTAVIVNEFGEAGLDHDLIETSTEEVVLMASGCLCCSVLGDLATTVAGLLTRRTAGEIAFERVVIETTGLADPGPILRTLQTDAFLAGNVRLDGVVTVADARHGARTLDTQFEAVSQVAMADLIVLSKTDTVPAAERQAFETRLRKLNPTARIRVAVKGAGVSEAIFGLGAARRGSAQAEALDWLAPRPAPAPDPLANLSGLAAPRAAPPPAPHDGRVASVSLVIDEPIADVALDLWLQTLMAVRGRNILRIKGVVFLEDCETPFAFHGVQDAIEDAVPIANWSGADRSSRIVVILKDADTGEIERSVEMLRMRPKIANLGV